MKLEIVIPAVGESVIEADIVSWYKSNGDPVEVDEPLLAIETEKATLDLHAEASGRLTILIREGTVKVGDVLGYITPEDKAVEAGLEGGPKPHIEKAAPIVEESSSYAKGHPSPAAAKLIAEEKMDASRITGMGKGGRITSADVRAALEKKQQEQEPAPVTKAGRPPLVQPVVSGERRVRREKMSRLRRTAAQRLVEAQHTAALVTTFNEVDMAAVIAIREKYKQPFKEKYNVNLGFMSFFTRAVCQSLQTFPILNASVENEEIIYHDYCDMGIAVATPKGLVVPVIQNAERLSFKEIEQRILDFTTRAREGKLALEDLSGGTFTITNGGIFGSMLSTPIVNPPQSAILGIHNIVERPVAVKGQVEIRPIMYLALTYDHRIIDGADAVRFLVMAKELIEAPTRMLIGI